MLALHLAGMHDASPPGTVFALDLSGLEAPEVTVWSAWQNDRIASIGGLKMLESGHAEIKSMRTHPDFIRRGAASAILDHLITVARERGVRHLSLETGRGAAFEAALSLYLNRGFEEGGRFSDYKDNGFSTFLHLSL